MSLRTITDTDRLNWLAANAHNLLAHRFDDGTFAFFARASREVSWPEPGTEPWQDLRTAIDDVLQSPSAIEAA
jgi:hypothetical protein